MRALKHIILFAIAAAVAMPGLAASMPDGADVLIKADKFRISGAELRSDIVITNIAGDDVSEAMNYTVYTHGANDTLALSSTGDAKGQKYLATEKGHWFYTPRSRRAIRINGMQRLQGQVVISDLTRMQWSGAYEVTAMTESMTSAKGEYRLDLKAVNGDDVYPRIVLYVAQQGGQPLRAEYYLSSGRVFRTALFDEPRKMGTSLAIIKTTYRNEVEQRKQTVIELVDTRHSAVPTAWFSPDLLDEAGR